MVVRQHSSVATSHVCIPHLSAVDEGPLDDVLRWLLCDEVVPTLLPLVVVSAVENPAVPAVPAGPVDGREAVTVVVMVVVARPPSSPSGPRS
jgi:hypothetical protein